MNRLGQNTEEVAAAESGEFSIFNWAALYPGDRIQLQYASGLERAAYVDEVSARGDVLWVRDPALNTRSLVHAVDLAGITCYPAEFNSARLAALQRPCDPEVAEGKLKDSLGPGLTGRWAM